MNKREQNENRAWLGLGLGIGLLIAGLKGCFGL